MVGPDRLFCITSDQSVGGSTGYIVDVFEESQLRLHRHQLT